MKNEPSRPRTSAVLAAVLAALIAKLVLDATTFGTNDVIGFLVFLREYQGSGAVLLYLEEKNINHPPLVLRLLVAVDALRRGTGLSWSFCLRLPAILADLGSLLLLLRMAKSWTEREWGTRATTAGLCLVAAAPVSIMVSGFHGNTDPLMCFLVLLSVFWLRRAEHAEIAGAAMGLAVSIKVVPLMLWPALFLWLGGWRSRARYFGAAIAVAVVGASPVIFQAPGIVAKKVLGYAGSYGLWGTSRVLSSVPALAPVSAIFEKFGAFVLAALLLALAIWMNRRAERPSPYRQVGLLFAAFLALAPGFGPQYLAWLVPWLLAWPLPAVALFLVCSGVFVFVLYTFWCQGVEGSVAVTSFFDPRFWQRGLPWRYANADQLGPWRAELVPLEVVCWLSVVVLFVLGLRSIGRRGRSLEPRPVPQPGGESASPATRG